MIIFWVIILGAILLVAFAFGAIGILCTENGRDWVSGLLFGVPAIILSLRVLVFCTRSVKPWICFMEAIT